MPSKLLSYGKLTLHGRWPSQTGSKKCASPAQWTQEQLALAAGVSRQSINSIERNRYVPSLELALIFARLFACSTDQIFHLEKEK